MLRLWTYQGARSKGRAIGICSHFSLGEHLKLFIRGGILDTWGWREAITQDDGRKEGQNPGKHGVGKTDHRQERKSPVWTKIRSDATRPALGQRLEHSRPAVNAYWVRERRDTPLFSSLARHTAIIKWGHQEKRGEDVRPNFLLASSDLTILTISGTFNRFSGCLCKFSFLKIETLRPLEVYYRAIYWMGVAGEIIFRFSVCTVAYLQASNSYLHIWLPKKMRMLTP